jgi:hypothetical protein
MTSVQPALISVKNNFRLITVTERNTKNPSITSTSSNTVMAGLIAFKAPTGLESIISSEDQAQREIPKTKIKTENIIVTSNDLIILLLSGVSSLTVFTPALKTEMPKFHT